MITDAVWLGLSVCFGISDVAVWGGHKQKMNGFLIVTGIFGCVLLAVQVTQLLFEIIAVLVHHGGSKEVWKLSFHDLFAYPGDHHETVRDPEWIERYGRNPRLGRYAQNDTPLSPTSSFELDPKDHKDHKEVKDRKDLETPASLLKHDYYDYADPYEKKGKLAKEEKSYGSSSGSHGSFRGDKKAMEAERELYAQYAENKVPSYTSH